MGLSAIRSHGAHEHGRVAGGCRRGRAHQGNAQGFGDRARRKRALLRRESARRRQARGCRSRAQRRLRRRKANRDYELLEVMWSFSEVIDGMAEACKVFNTPVVSGNVSFYNETEGRGVLPTPVIGMIGLIEDVKRVVQPGFKNPGDFIALLGATKDDLSISEYT